MTLTYSESLALLRTLHLLKWASRCGGSCESCLLLSSACSEKCASAMSEAVDA